MIITTEMIPQLNINKLLKGQYIIEGGISEGTYSSEGHDPLLHISSDCRTKDRSLKVKYNVLDSVQMMDYEIQIETIQIGSGKGKNFYLICPCSKKRAKVLYLCSRCNLFIHRSEYFQRIYYPSEIHWGFDRTYANQQATEKRLLRSFLHIKKSTHRGDDTKINKTIQKLIDRKETLDCLISEWQIKRIRKLNKFN